MYSLRKIAGLLPIVPPALLVMALRGANGRSEESRWAMTAGKRKVMEEEKG